MALLVRRIGVSVDIVVRPGRTRGLKIILGKALGFIKAIGVEQD